MSGNALPRTILRAVGCNGIGRFVPQLQRVTLKFCKSREDSKGLRDYIEQRVVEFATHNPATVVYIKPRRHRPPIIVAEYLCGNWQYLRPDKMDCEEIHNWMQLFRNRSGLDIMPIYKYWSTKSPSIQGMWHPFYEDMQREKRLLSPSEIIENLNELSEAEPPLEPSAESKLLDLWSKQRQRLE